jgi:flavodoxin
MGAIVITASVHQGNTDKLARVIAELLGAERKRPWELRRDELGEYELAGFGSGIYDAKHHDSLLRLAASLPPSPGRKAFIFSTNGVPIALAGKALVAKNSIDSHAELRSLLLAAGYEIVGEFGCAGFNKNSFLKYFGGINRGRPNVEDLADAKEFARRLGSPKGGSLGS